MYAGMLQSVLSTARRRDPEPGAVQKELLASIDFFETESYASLVYGQLGPNGRVRYFNAGHRRRFGSVARETSKPSRPPR